jgi:hypothetical protein
MLRLVKELVQRLRASESVNIKLRAQILAEGEGAENAEDKGRQVRSAVFRKWPRAKS